MVGLHAQRVNDVTVCTVGSEPWRGSLSDRTLIAETGAPLFSFQPCHRHAETRIGAAVWVPGVDRATVSPAGRMLTPTPTWTGPTVSRVSQLSRKSSCGARRNRFSVFAEPTLRTSRNGHDVARAADPLFEPLSIQTVCSFA
jgi:hypothetical protein